MEALKHDIYYKAYCNVLVNYTDNTEKDAKHAVKQLIIYGVKAVNTKPERKTITREEAASDFQFASVIKSLIGFLTPAEFMNIFPIEKEFKGHKWHFKDYFYTRDYIKGLDLDKPLGEDALKFLWEYTNWEITKFNIAIMEYMSNLRRLDGQPSLAGEWAEMNGIKTHTLHKDQKGREFLIDNETGKSTRIRKRRPRHLKVIKTH